MTAAASRIFEQLSSKQAAGFAARASASLQSDCTDFANAVAAENTGKAFASAMAQAKVSILANAQDKSANKEWLKSTNCTDYSTIRAVVPSQLANNNKARKFKKLATAQAARLSKALISHWQPA